MSNGSYQPKTYREQGGDRHVIASGGSLDVESGGEIDIEAGGALKIAGVAVTSSAAELNKMDGVLRTPAEINLLAQGVAAGYKIARGVDAVTGTKDITTGLATVVAIVAMLAGDPVLAHALLVTAEIPAQADATAGHATLKVWRPTAANDVTPLAGDDARNVSWVAIGT